MTRPSRIRCRASSIQTLCLAGRKSVAPTVTSRGCPFHRIPRNRMGRTCRWRSAGYVLREMDQIVECSVRAVGRSEEGQSTVSRPEDGEALEDIGRLADDPRPGMALIDAVRTRRTVRSFQEGTVPRDLLRDLLRLSTHAPSACNRRGWRFILIEAADDLAWLHAKGASSVLERTRQAILVCYLSDSDNAAWRDTEQSAAAAIAYFQLIAHCHGIGSCWICQLPSRSEVGRHFGVPAGYVPAALVAVGSYRPETKVRPRHPAEAGLMAVNRWSFEDEPEPAASVLRRGVRKMLRRLYYLFPKREWFRKQVSRCEKQFDNEVHDQ